MAKRAVRLQPDVTALVSALKHRSEAVITALRRLVLDVDPRIEEHVKWNAPSFAVGEADFATFHLRSKTGLQVVLHLGAKPRPDARVRTEVPDPAGLLVWRGADRAIVTFTDLADVEEKRQAFTAIVGRWLKHL
jgi:hypothetical protein